MTNTKKVVVAITAPVSVVLIRGQLAQLEKAGYEPYLVCSPGEEARELASLEKSMYLPVPMKRDPAPFSDVISLFGIICALIKVRPYIINAGTPKAGFLTIVAGWAVRCPVRIYTIHGFRHESLLGWRRSLQVWIERACCRLATHVVCVSNSVMSLAIRESICGPEKMSLIGNGSCGIELDRFQASDVSSERKYHAMNRLGLNNGEIVLGFVGRLIPRKGVAELLSAWTLVAQKHPNARLLLVGAEEAGQPLEPALKRQIESDPSIIVVGFVSDVSLYMSLMDVLALPSHWEGFGNVLVEAASMGIPVITTDVTGTKDAVSNGVNGTLVPGQDVNALFVAIDEYISNDELRSSHGRAGPEWARRFGREEYARQLAEFYKSIG